MDCVCKNMTKIGNDMHVPIYKSANYRGFALYENYGQWDLKFENDSKSIEIFYCPFCGRKLNHWSWTNERRKENFEKYVER